MTSSQQRFVILHHDHPFEHWDLMLQRGDVLETWRLLDKPVPGQWIAADRLPDHRLEYLDYEGPVSRNRGCVRRLVAGTYERQSVDALLLHGWSDVRRAVLRPSVDSQNSAEWRFE